MNTFTIMIPVVIRGGWGGVRYDDILHNEGRR